jgi:hypothetical protein
MVKIGFIVEGGSEKVIVESERFVQWLKSIGIELSKPVIDAKGGGNLLPQNIEPMIKRLNQQGVDHIAILTDLEDEADTEVVKERIGTEHSKLIFIAIKAIEAWYLADSQSMNTWLGITGFYEDRPQETPLKPWDRLKELSEEYGKPGPGASKIVFAKRMVKHYGLDLTASAKHENCNSAAEMIECLKGLVHI